MKCLDFNEKPNEKLKTLNAWLSLKGKGSVKLVKLMTAPGTQKFMVAIDCVDSNVIESAVNNNAHFFESTFKPLLGNTEDDALEKWIADTTNWSIDLNIPSFSEMGLQLAIVGVEY